MTLLLLGLIIGVVLGRNPSLLKDALKGLAVRYVEFKHSFKEDKNGEK